MTTDQRTQAEAHLPLVSVIIPTYNRAHQVGAAIDSALSQTYTRFEVIVVNDGSKDNTREVLAAYGNKIRAIHQENRGLSAARNAGIRAARGQLIALLDDDDTWRPRKLDLQVALFADPDVHVVHAGGHFYNDDGTWSSEQFVGEHIDFHKLLQFKIIYVQTVIARRAVFDRVGLFDESLRSGEDWDMWLRMALHYPLTGLNACVADIRCNPEGMQAKIECFFGGLMTVVKRHSRHHGRCAECRSAYRASVRQIRSHYYEKCKERAVAARQDGRYTQAVRHRIRAFRYDPAALLLSPLRAARRLVTKLRSHT